MCSHGRHVHQSTLLSEYPSVVYHSLLGNAKINNNLVVLENYPIIMRKDYKSMTGKVKIIGGGGAGTEPAESYYVGKGMLTAAVVGDILRAPSCFDILTAIRELAVNNSDGILLLVKNYLGDRLNFSLALDKAVDEKISIKMLVIGDNITEDKHGRKGLAGSVLVYKIAGEMAEQGKSLNEIFDECREIILTDLYTVNAVLSPFNQALSQPLVDLLEPYKAVLGVGIYGSQGTKLIKISNLQEAVFLVIQELFTSFVTRFEQEESNIILLINNLGGLSKLEESIVALEASTQLNVYGVKIAKMFVGSFMSSLNTQGFSVTILKINTLETLYFLNAPTLAPGWPKLDSSENNCESVTVSPQSSNVVHVKESHCQENNVTHVLSQKAVLALKQITIFAAEALISCERQLNIIDSEVGDGDTGTIIKRGAEALRDSVINDKINITNPCQFLLDVSEICCKNMGGLTGALYSIFFSSAAKSFNKSKDFTPESCSIAFKSAVKELKQCGKAELGDRTVLDALYPAAEAFESAIQNGKNLTQAVYSAAATCEYKVEKTKNLKPIWLRNFYIKKPLLYADAGAHAASIWLRAISEGLKLNYPLEC